MKLLLPLLLITASLSAQDVYRFPEGAQSRVSSFENLNGKKGAGGQTNKTAKGNAFERLQAGESKVLLDVQGTGMIQRMWFTVRDRDPKTLRSMHLQIFWDGDSKAAVDVPFGDFFVANLGKTTAFQSALFSSPEGRSYNCYISMPFRKGAKVVLTNEGSTIQSMLYFDIDYVFLKTLPADAMYFHAYWTRQPNNPLKQDFVVLPTLKGKGRFLGMSVGVNADKKYGKTWWGEGEVKMYLDGDSKLPTINGTGTEDYIGTGWGLSAFSNTYQGCPVASDSLSQYNFYRWHLPDAIYFNTDIKVALQEIGGGEFDEVKSIFNKGIPLDPISVDGPAGFSRIYEMNPSPSINDDKFPRGWVNFYRIDDYSAVSYFYYYKSSSPLPKLAELAVRVEGLK
ncbi:MAG: DUF2961 domain-containing protein [Chitinophagaceae bacterium]|nr:DUF2961 domain-containing protein [Chitinophagaceae bacterium]